MKSRQFWDSMAARDDWREFLLPKRTESQFEFEGCAEAQRLSRFLRPGDRVLEIGCGNGRVLRHLRGDGLAVGVDISHGLLAKSEEIQYGVVADGVQLPFRDKAFEFIYSLNVLLHLDPETKRRLVEEVVRVCARFALLFFPAKEAGYYKSARDSDGFIYPLSRKELEDMTKKLGLNNYNLRRGGLVRYGGPLQEENPEWILGLAV